MNDLHAAHFRERRHAAGKFFKDRFFPCTEFRQVHARLRERDAAMRRFARVDDLMRRVKQRLRGNAAAIQTHAAELFVTLDEDDFFAQIGCIKSRRVTTRAGTDDNNFRFDRVHT